MSDVRFFTLYPELCPLNQTLKDPGNALGTLLKVFTMRLEPCTLKGGHPPKSSASILVKPRNRIGGWFTEFRAKKLWIGGRYKLRLMNFLLWAKPKSKRPNVSVLDSFEFQSWSFTIGFRKRIRLEREYYHGLKNHTRR